MQRKHISLFKVESIFTILTTEKVITKSVMSNIKKMIFKKICLYFLTTATILTASTTAMADSLVSNGSGGNSRGDYSYELWQTANNNRYYLKIWEGRETNKPGELLSSNLSFESSRKALDYFDCNYAGKSLPTCPK